MMGDYNAKNYTEQGGEKTVIGGTLEIAADATVIDPGNHCSGGTYTLPAATAETLGGVKVGSRLSISDGVLSADDQVTPAGNQADSEATTIAALKEDFNALLGKLKAAGFMEADTEEGGE